MGAAQVFHPEAVPQGPDGTGNNHAFACGPDQENHGASAFCGGKLGILTGG